MAAVLGGVAAPASSQVVISQLYAGHGNTYDRDYVELFNRGQAPVSVSGWSVQFASATGTGLFSGSVGLDGILQPGRYLLVGLAESTTGGAAIPTPDASGSTNILVTGGKVVLVNTGSPLGCNGGSTPCSAAQLARIMDLVGYGSANFFEGTSAAPAVSSTTALFRADGGCTDGNDNSSDFGIGPPDPRNSASTTNPCGPSGNEVPISPGAVALLACLLVALGMRLASGREKSA